MNRCNRMRLFLIFIMALLTSFGVARAGAVQAGTSEIRGVWLHLENVFSADPAKGKAEVNQFVERMANAGFNLILPWVRSEYMAALTDESYQKSVPIAKCDDLGASSWQLARKAWRSIPGTPSPITNHRAVPTSIRNTRATRTGCHANWMN